MKIILALLGISVLACGCSDTGQASSVLEDVRLPGKQSSRSVLYFPASSPDCEATAHRASQIGEAKDVVSPVVGLKARDVRDGLQPFRAYFVPRQFVDSADAAFVFCRGYQPALLPVQCILVGTSDDGCFQTGIYGIADAAGIGTTVDAIRSQWPESFVEESGRW